MTQIGLPSLRSVKSDRLLALHFPHLALDLFTRGQTAEKTPIAVSAVTERREWITDCNPTARAGGVRPGMPVTAALGILDGLQVMERDHAAEERALQRLAAWCYQYSSEVCIPGDRPGLFVETAASERLFGRPEGLGQRLVQELGRLGYHAAPGSAATPEAAWLAAQEGWYIEGGDGIRRQLGALPLQRLHLEPTQIAAMERMGFRQLRDLWRLPRKALTRRFGPSLPDYLDRLLGIRADPRALYRPPESFSAGLELPAEVHARQALLFPLKRLLEELCGVLRGGDTAVQRLRIVLHHEDHADSQLELGLQAPGQDPARLLAVLRERLERLRLPAPIRALRLEAPKLLPFAAGQRSLFRDAPAEQRQDIEQLAERLQARLGRDAVSGVTGVEDHRPEYSWRPRALRDPPQATALPHRPAWLLPRPQRCTIGNYEILAGPERIESGWWDGHDCRRDYFIVRDAHGSMLWAFREYKPHPGWYLHGIFG